MKSAVASLELHATVLTLQEHLVMFYFLDNHASQVAQDCTVLSSQLAWLIANQAPETVQFRLAKRKALQMLRQVARLCKPWSM